MLKSAFETALTADELTATVYGWWLDDASGSDSEEAVFPQVNLKAAPNIPEGYRSPVRMVPVTIDIVTFEPDDRKRAAAVAIYNCIREVLDGDELSSESFSAVPAITIDDGGDVYDEAPLQLIRLEITVHVCLGAQTDIL